MKKGLIAGFALLACASTASAQNSITQNGNAQTGISNPTQVVQNFDTANLIPIIQEMGLEWRGVSVPSSDGGENINIMIVRAPSGFVLTLHPTACQNGANSGCIGLSIMAGFTGNVPQSSVNAFNYHYPFVSAGMDESGAAFLSRYEIADYGTIKGNVISSVFNFITMGATFSETMFGAKQTVSLDSFSDDLAAGSLNRRALASAGITQAHASRSIDIHDAEFARASELMKILVKADEKAPGKILNVIGK